MSNLEWNVGIKLDGAGAQQQFDQWLNAAVGGSMEAKKKINKELGGKEEKKVSILIDSNTGQLVRQSKQVLTEWNKIQKAIDYSNKTVKGSLTSLRAQLRTQMQLRDNIVRYTAGVRRSSDAWIRQNKIVEDLNRKIADASGNWMKMLSSRIPGGQNVMNLANGLSQVSMAATATVMTIQAVAGAIKPVVARAKQMQALDLAFQGFGLSAEQSAQFMQQAKAQALKYGSSLIQVEKGYKRIAPAIMQSGGSMQDVSESMASLSARVTTLGLNSEQSGRYIEAFAQVMGKGKLQGEELNQQFSELDGALRGQLKSYVKAKYGITDFEEAMRKGEVTSGMFREAFNASAEDMRNNLGGAIGEVQSRIGELNVAQIENIGNSLNTITMESLVETLAPIGKQMQSVILMFQQFFANIATSMPATQEYVKGLLTVIGALIQVTVVGLLGALKAVFVAFEFVNWITFELLKGIARLIEMIPGLGGMFAKIGDIFLGAGKALATFTDSWMKVGDSAKATEQELSSLDGRIEILRNKIEEGTGDTEELRKKLEELQDQAQQELDTQALDNYKEKIKELKEQINEAQIVETDKKSLWDEENQKLSVLKGSVKAYYEGVKQAHAERTQRVKDFYDSELSRLARNKEAMKESHRSAMEDLKARNQASINALEKEIQALQARTPAEEKLQVLRKQEILDKLKSTDLSEKEKLELQAQLERMQRQKEIEEKQLKLKAEKENAAKAEAQLAKQQRAEAKQAAEEEKQMREQKKEALKELKRIGKDIDEQQKNTTSLFENQKEVIDLTGKTFAEINDLVSRQADLAYEAADGYEAAKTNVSQLKTQLKQAQAEAARLGRQLRSNNAATPPTTPPNAFTGGSVKGGASRTVNEFGREGFLSLSGRLSEINAPAWGSWKAPSSGTIIPAHVWAQVKAQGLTGGPTRTPTAVGATGNMMARVSALGKTGSSDIVTNNVTIQSEDVDRTMHQSLISLRRTKRARYY